MNEILRPHAEDAYAHELTALEAQDSGVRPAGWRLSPRAVVRYLMGDTLDDGTEITPKYFGDRRLIEVAVASLVTDRALLLVGVPGTAKTWVSEHLTAAISGDSKLLVQGTAGMSEDALRYGWNYARLLAEGPSEEALVPSPIMVGMRAGKLVRIEELTRVPSDVQDALITVLSEKILPIPELGRETQARRGFNVVATANDRDRGVNELSSALRRRFNTVVMPLPATLEEEVRIVTDRSRAAAERMQLPPVKKDAVVEITRLVTIFRELRNGRTEDGRTQVKSPSSTLSTAEAISVVNQSRALSHHFGTGDIETEHLAASLSGAVVKDPERDGAVWREYVDVVVRNRKGWEELFESLRV
ncbi:dynein-related subfamily AAA family protein [Neolewinella xylanilytica]|uniref:Dynein-related subfamily AAA family protein n=1 Tax=Neolewinella xylanilytica TaxID=1514080 RepID=A0A2S6I2U7_9BACT|nr:AAA family ATPase [Neolewinella xylanilytica]PPK85470.1 dynein-related subfamily AAA family protein [Neolewinella xylanilytica]